VDFICVFFVYGCRSRLSPSAWQWGHIAGCLQCVVKQDCEYHSDGHANDGFENEFNDGFKGHGIEMIETFAPSFVGCFMSDFLRLGGWGLVIGLTVQRGLSRVAPKASRVRGEPVKARAVETFQRKLVGVMVAGCRDWPGQHAQHQKADSDRLSYYPVLLCFCDHCHIYICFIRSRFASDGQTQQQTPRKVNNYF
jgi:hypothetical protein